jgi:hypothetical protein
MSVACIHDHFRTKISLVDHEEADASLELELVLMSSKRDEASFKWVGKKLEDTLYVR